MDKLMWSWLFLICEHLALYYVAHSSLMSMSCFRPCASVSALCHSCCAHWACTFRVATVRAAIFLVFCTTEASVSLNSCTITGQHISLSLNMMIMRHGMRENQLTAPRNTPKHLKLDPMTLKVHTSMNKETRQQYVLKLHGVSLKSNITFTMSKCEKKCNE